MRSRVVIVFVSLALAGCYDSHGTMDTGSLMDGMTVGDAGPCRAGSGALLCGTSECPSEACELSVELDADLCERSQPGAVGYCSLELTDVLSAGAIVSPCVVDGQSTPLLLEPGFYNGNCGIRGICDEVVALGFPPENRRCVYVDGSLYDDGVIPAASCEGLPSSACGPGCAACDDGFACFGPSEQSGLGVCIPLDRGRFVRGELNTCGVDLPRGFEYRCPAGTGCLDFVVPDPVPGVMGRCVPTEDCLRLAAGAPDRFVCDPEG